jgi:hypothetical protein
LSATTTGTRRWTRRPEGSNWGDFGVDDRSDESSGPHGLLPLHERCLFKLGIHLGELWWLSELAGYLRKAGRHAFLLTAPPLRLPGAVGSPMTPVATV